MAVQCRHQVRALKICRNLESSGDFAWQHLPKAYSCSVLHQYEHVPEILNCKAGQCGPRCCIGLSPCTARDDTAFSRGDDLMSLSCHHQRLSWRVFTGALGLRGRGGGGVPRTPGTTGSRYACIYFLNGEP